MFPGQEHINCWSVVRMEGVGQDENFDDFVEGLKEGDTMMWADGESLTLADAAALADDLAAKNPERRYFVLPAPWRRRTS
jgi:hypothetical protein